MIANGGGVDLEECVEHESTESSYEMINSANISPARSSRHIALAWQTGQRAKTDAQRLKFRHAKHLDVIGRPTRRSLPCGTETAAAPSSKRIASTRPAAFQKAIGFRTLGFMVK